MRPNQSQRCDPAFSAVTPISEEVTPKVSELCSIGVLLHVGAKYALLKNRQLVRVVGFLV